MIDPVAEKLLVICVEKSPIDVGRTAEVLKVKLLPRSHCDAVKVLAPRCLDISSAGERHAVGHRGADGQVEYIVGTIENRNVVGSGGASVSRTENIKEIGACGRKSYPLRRKPIQPVAEK